jgi:hypothetical protein
MNMELHFNVTGDSRKAMVKAIEKELGCKAKYLGMPSAAYEVGAYRVERDGTLTSLGENGTDEEAKVVDACVTATGVSPAEWENNQMGAKEADCEPEKGATEGETAELTVTIPLEKVAVGNLTSLLDAKGDLIRKALGITDLRVSIEEETISFPWFEEVTPEEAAAYTKFIAALCEMSRKQKRITAKPKENENEKYAFRCFLLRLGFIGDEFKADRKILLSRLEGSSAFKSGAKGGER